MFDGSDYSDLLLFRGNRPTKYYTYTEILKRINRLGKSFERLPDSYKDKKEEVLRNQFHSHIDPDIEGGSATGETFNSSGKIDILIRHEDKIIFIAEFKLWHGLENYLQPITQLLSYLTWRESKCAIIIFVRQTKFIDVLNTINEKTKSHPNYLEFISKSDENWFNFRFHFEGDENCKINLAIFLFHFPKGNM